MTAQTNKESSFWVLVGMPGVGKTSVGRAVAALAARQHIDLDFVIRESTGMSPSELITQEGEPAFRRVEAAALRGVVEASSAQGIVLSLGGGALHHPGNYDLLREHSALLIYLSASERSLRARLSENQLTERPLLSSRGDSDPLAELLRVRLPLFESIEHRVDTDELDVAEVAASALSVFERIDHAG